MIKRRASKRITVKSKGSAAKKRSGARIDRLDRKDWTLATIAWNRDGNVVILDPRVAKLLRDRARKDHELEIGIPNLPVEIGDGSRTAMADSVPQPITSGPGPQPLTLCGCELMLFRLEKEMPVRTKLLSSEKMR